MLAAEHVRRVNAGGGLLAPCVLGRGRVKGTWTRTLSARAMTIDVTLFEKCGRAFGRSLENAAQAYARFVGRAQVDVVCRVV